MVRAKYCSKHSGSRYRRKKRRPFAPCSHGSSKALSCTSSRPTSPSPKGHSRSSSLDSLNYRGSSYDRLKHPAKCNSDMIRSHHRPPHYDRMVWEAVARLKSRKGSSSREIVKALKRRYPDARKYGSKTIERVMFTAKKLVREGKLVKDGSRYRLSKTSAGKSRDSHDDSDYSHRSRSASRTRTSTRTSIPSRHRSSGKAKRVLRGKKVKRSYRSAGRSTKRGAKRGKKGSRKGKTKLASGRRGSPRQKKANKRVRRRAKHSSTSQRRAKSEKLPDGEISQNRGWFGGWFGGKGGGGESNSQGNQSDTRSSSKPQGRPKKQQGGSEPALDGPAD